MSQQFERTFAKSRIEHLSFTDSTFECAAHHVRLLIHLFLHEVAVIALLHVVIFHFDLYIGADDKLIGDIPDVDAIGSQIH